MMNRPKTEIASKDLSRFRMKDDERIGCGRQFFFQRIVDKTKEIRLQMPLVLCGIPTSVLVMPCIPVRLNHLHKNIILVDLKIFCHKKNCTSIVIREGNGTIPIVEVVVVDVTVVAVIVPSVIRRLCGQCCSCSKREPVLLYNFCTAVRDLALLSAFYSYNSP